MGYKNDILSLFMEYKNDILLFFENNINFTLNLRFEPLVISILSITILIMFVHERFYPKNVILEIFFNRFSVVFRWVIMILLGIIFVCDPYASIIIKTACLAVLHIIFYRRIEPWSFSIGSLMIIIMQIVNPYYMIWTWFIYDTVIPRVEYGNPISKHNGSHACIPGMPRMPEWCNSAYENRRNVMSLDHIMNGPVTNTVQPSAVPTNSTAFAPTIAQGNTSSTNSVQTGHSSVVPGNSTANTIQSAQRSVVPSSNNISMLPSMFGLGPNINNRGPTNISSGHILEQPGLRPGLRPLLPANEGQMNKPSKASVMHPGQRGVVYPKHFVTPLLQRLSWLILTNDLIGLSPQDKQALLTSSYSRLQQTNDERIILDLLNGTKSCIRNLGSGALNKEEYIGSIRTVALKIIFESRNEEFLGQWEKPPRVPSAMTHQIAYTDNNFGIKCGTDYNSKFYRALVDKINSIREEGNMPR